MKKLFFVLAIGIFLFFSGCIQECNVNEDCATGEVCVNGMCEAAPTPPPQPPPTPTTPNATGPAPPLPGDVVVDTSGYEENTENQKLIISVLESYSYEDDASFDNANKILALGPDATDDMIVLTEKENRYSKWTGLYALLANAKTTEGDARINAINAFEQMLDSDVPSFRLMAGEGLLSMGEKRGFEAVIAMLEDRQTHMLSEPATLKCTHANDVLVRYSEKDFGFTCNLDEIDEDGKAEWNAWWQANKDSLVWDNGKKKFVEG
ncbi:MAG: hypothetical protein ABIH83_00475 [Candidatus Micrarchaeota archaeon]